MSKEWADMTKDHLELERLRRETDDAYDRYLVLRTARDKLERELSNRFRAIMDARERQAEAAE